VVKVHLLLRHAVVGKQHAACCVHNLTYCVGFVDGPNIQNVCKSL
jgi:hypothetical protein